MSTLPPKKPNQSALWNGPAGQSWVEAEAVINVMFQPILQDLVDLTCRKGVNAVLDIGCGSGAVAIDIAKTIGLCTGIDVSALLVEQAQALAKEARSPALFIQADAQNYGFQAGAYDLLVSRFGVMFFEDTLEAFSNLRRATRPGGLLRFVVWRSADENPFLTAAERAAAPLVPDLAKRIDGAVGPFAFSDPDPVIADMTAAGWRDVEFEPVDYPLSFQRSDLDLFMTRLGALGQVFAQADEALKARLLETVRAAFDPFIAGDEVQFMAACWVIKATNPLEGQDD